MIRAQQFREDLYLRIAEVGIEVPPLRARHRGIAVLAHTVLSRLASMGGSAKRSFAPDAVAAMEAYTWPGNVRGLENRIKAAVLLAEGPVIGACDLGSIRWRRHKWCSICAKYARDQSIKP